MNNPKLVKKITSWLVAFISSVALVGLCILGILHFTLFNEQFMMHAAKQANYSQTITNEINTSITDLGRASNIPPAILKDSVSKEDVSENINHYIQAIYQNKTFELVGEDQLKTTLDRKIQAYAQQKGLTIDASSQEAIDNLKQQAVTRYQQYIEIPYLLTYGSKVIAYTKQLNIFIGLCAIAFILLLLSGIHFFSRLLHRRLRYVASIVGGAGLMLIVLPAILLISRYIQRLAINSKALYDFITTYLTSFTLTFIYWGIGCLVVYGILLLFSELQRKKMVHH